MRLGRWLFLLSLGQNEASGQEKHGKEEEEQKRRRRRLEEPLNAGTKGGRKEGRQESGCVCVYVCCTRNVINNAGGAGAASLYTTRTHLVVRGYYEQTHTHTYEDE